jgi:hypothetical protein
VETNQHDMANLFAQLGLPSDAQAIGQFIESHHPLPSAVRLSAAPFWTAAQAAFLQEGTLTDADWAAVIDALDEELRARG